MKNNTGERRQARGLSYTEQERICETEFLSGGPYWHLSTDGNKQEIIFIDDEDFKFAMTTLALLLLVFKVRVIAFVFMNNHLHWILEGQESECLSLFKAFTRKLRAYLHKKGRYGVLDGFDCGKPIAITTLEQMRNEIAYVHRNPFVVRLDVLPYTYRWSDGYLYFNPINIEKNHTKFKDLGFDRKRSILHSRIQSLPDHYQAEDDYILPVSFSCYKKGMSFFRHASQYFGHITKNIESSAEIARRLRDKIILNDEEVYPLTRKLCGKLFGGVTVKELTSSQKLDLAKRLHFEYNIGNKQLSRVLGINPSIVDGLFPVSRQT